MERTTEACVQELNKFYKYIYLGTMQHREVLIMTNGVLFFPWVVAFSTAGMYALVHGQIPTHTPATKPSLLEYHRSPHGIQLTFCAWKLRPGFPLSMLCSLLQSAIQDNAVVGISLRHLFGLKWMSSFYSSVSYEHEKLGIFNASFQSNS